MRTRKVYRDQKLEGDRRERSFGITANDLQVAVEIVQKLVPPTPQIRLTLPNSSGDHDLVLKLETSAPTGSFKVRGATHFFEKYISSRRATTNQFITASTGNHGVSLAWVGRQFGQQVTVVVPAVIPQAKLQKLQNTGAKVILHGQTLDDAIRWARLTFNEEGSIFIPSFNPDIILGHSTLGTEIFTSEYQLSRIYFPIGLGSGILGLALARDVLSPKTEIFGIVPERCDAWAKSFDAGMPIKVNPGPTIADGLRTAQPDYDMWRVLRPRIAGVLRVSEKEIQTAQSLCASYLNIKPEGAGVVGLAGLLRYSKPETRKEGLELAVICG